MPVNHYVTRIYDGPLLVAINWTKTEQKGEDWAAEFKRSNRRFTHTIEGPEDR